MRTLAAALFMGAALAAPAQERTLGVSAREPAEERIALVIGNSAYKVGPLRNPVNDARAMTRALRKGGFQVDHRENLTHRQMFEATRDFGENLKPGVVALFYYAGHGLQVRDRNFLIPVEADMKTEEEVPYTSIDAAYALDVMSRARTRVNIVILDACRNNPFARSFRSASRGLAQMEAPSGTLIAYATAPGRVASDGSGEHGLYTQHLLAHLETPGLPVELLFKRVREGVERETRSQQVPWESSSLKGEFSFVAAPAAAAPARPAAPATAAAPDAAFELAFWDSIKASSEIADYNAYLAQYPNGRFALLAKARISTLAPVPELSRPEAPVASLAPTAAASSRLPRVGEAWVYQYTDLWKPAQKVRIRHTIAAVSDDLLSENVAILTDGLEGSVGGGHLASTMTVWPTSAQLGEWRLGQVTMREFTPFALALDLVRPGQRIDDVAGMPTGGLADWSIGGRVSEEAVSVPAGTFRATKVVLKGQRQAYQGMVGSFEMTVWYAPEIKRYVKLVYNSYATTRGAGADPWHRDLYELVSAPAR
jgi:uncharacterized caspase-like protein